MKSAAKGPNVTRLGAWVVVPFVLLMFGVFSLQYVAPRTWIGHAMSLRIGRFLVAGLFIVAGVALEKWLARRGRYFLEQPTDDEKG